jgi:hypothetical protein
MVCYAQKSPCKLIQPITFHTNQNIYRFVSVKDAHQSLIPHMKQKQYENNFFVHFFSPWTTKKLKATIKLTSNIRSYHKAQTFNINNYRRHLGYGENYQPHTKAWFNKIVDNMNMLHFPNKDRNAITVHNVLVRYVPTMDPHFGNFSRAGEGYPFDNFQKSMVMVGTPIHVYQVSKEGDWVFIKSPAVFGWVQTKDIAYVSSDFIKRWEVPHYVTVVVKKYSLKDSSGIYRFHAYLGSAFPLISEDAKSYGILIPVANINRQAVIRNATVSKKVMQAMPLAATPMNFARLVNQLLGEPYGWGGLFFSTDCSSALKNIYAAFGIWLPRNSGAQAAAGKQVNLSKLSATERQDYILRYGVPFTTLIHVPGHIMMYLGGEDGKVVTFQNVWAFQTWNQIRGKYCEGRAIVGKALVLPLELNYAMGMTPQIAVNELDISFL